MKLIKTLFLSVFFVILMSSLSIAECGIASWYSLPGNKTASGDIMNPSEMTAAHKTLPFGTKITVTNKKNNKKVNVIVNDRGPYIKGRIIDLSKAAARKIGITENSGIGQVCIK